jgi:hypothetical protein
VAHLRIKKVVEIETIGCDTIYALLRKSMNLINKKLNRNLRLNLGGEQWEKDYDNIFLSNQKTYFYLLDVFD